MKKYEITVSGDYIQDYEDYLRIVKEKDYITITAYDIQYESYNPRDGVCIKAKSEEAGIFDIVLATKCIFDIKEDI